MSRPDPVDNAYAGGITIGAAALLFVGGVLEALQGISALADDKIFVIGEDYVYSFNLTTWGWIHLILGIIGIAVAIGMAMGSDWARMAAIVIASVSIIAQFMWLPQHPWWAILIIAVDVMIIWAVSTWRLDTA
ncbi:DUF7144 family membrane protein [Gordonia humi]|uniref:Uncharacterized membrane protein YbaN (DUF454 family) n=1 Tax=Gordonia humi TaxID=686429 RepID=A0A840F548_9ACTN|nr:hypothetical protein [Gordonia humi]MBB4137643.1 uncharacterized membrane protein YbaN (DUF454 family) [Gordonia humi]